MGYRIFGKRSLDLLVSSLMFLCLSPVFVTLCIVNFFYYRGTPFYFQERPGRQGVSFQILKFKTMSDARSKEGNLLPDEKRITWLGKILRKASLDEIPQLLNVLKGDMSLVGPRPLLPEYLLLYNPTQARRHEVRPGVTGLAQINGRNAISWEKKFDYDVWYVDHLSLGMDLQILFGTFWNVLRGKGVSQQGQVSVGKFTGSGQRA